MISTRIDISVPRHEARLALSRGAQWDGLRKTFVMPRGCEAREFRQWWGIDTGTSDTLVVGPFYLLSARARCCGCGRSCSVFCLAASAVFDLGAEEPLFGGPFILHSLERLENQLGSLFRAAAPGLALVRLDPRVPRCLMNHCGCGVPQPGPEAAREGGRSIFTPESAAEAEALSHAVLPLAGVLGIRGSWSAFGDLRWWWRMKRMAGEWPRSNVPSAGAERPAEH
jgi:hypothetical protein